MKRIMKKLLCGLLIATLAFPVVPAQAQEREPVVAHELHTGLATPTNLHLKAPKVTQAYKQESFEARFDQKTEQAYWKQFTTDYYYKKVLNNNQRALWKELDRVCMNLLLGKKAPEKIQDGSDVYYMTQPVNYYTINEAQAEQVVFLFGYANPQYFFLDTSIFSVDSGVAMLLVYDNFGTKAKLKAGKEKLRYFLNSWVHDIEKTVPNYSSSNVKQQFAVEMEIHDYLCDLVSYDYVDMNQSIYSIIASHKTVCAGYTKAMVAMLSYFDIVNCYAFCMPSDESEGGNHVWNEVYIGGKWYVVDATWDDDVSGLILRLFYNTTIDEIERICQDDIVSYESHTDDNYPSWLNTSHVPLAKTVQKKQYALRLPALQVKVAKNSKGNYYFAMKKPVINYDGAVDFSKMKMTYSVANTAFAKKETPTKTYNGSAVALKFGGHRYFQGMWKSSDSRIQSSRIVFVEESTISKSKAADSSAIFIGFDACGGKMTQKGTVGATGYTFGPLPTPKRTGYTFVGWYTKKSKGTKVTSKTKITAKQPMMLYERWKGKVYTVKFHANGGKVSTKSKKYRNGGKYGKLPTPKRTGYKFTGWYTKKKGGSKITKASRIYNTKNITLYAHWKKVKK